MAWSIASSASSVLVVSYGTAPEYASAGEQQLGHPSQSLRDCKDPQAVKAAMEALASRWAACCGGPVNHNAPEWVEPVRLYPETKQVRRFNESRLQQLVGGGAEDVTQEAA